MAETRKVLIVGAGGRMGLAMARLIAQRAVPGLELVAAVDRAGAPLVGQDAGIAAEYIEYPGVFHGFASMFGTIAEADQAVEKAGEVIRRTFA